MTDDQAVLKYRVSRVVRRPDMYKIGDIIGLLNELYDALDGAPKQSDPIAIDLLEGRIRDLQVHNQNLLIYNNELLTRARAAEHKLAEPQAAMEKK